MALPENRIALKNLRRCKLDPGPVFGMQVDGVAAIGIHYIGKDHASSPASFLVLEAPRYAHSIMLQDYTLDIAYNIGRSETPYCLAA
jgi:hypothetical protein